MEYIENTGFLNPELIKQKFDFVSRYDRRKSRVEADKLITLLTEAENAFIESLFQPDTFDAFEYQNIYTFFLEEFLRRSDWIDNVYKPKYYNINSYYFEEKYKALENLKTNQ